jgi:glyoxylase-like metal-dependent hydrolase (beta-lactamase superfamily II)
MATGDAPYDVFALRYYSRSANKANEFFRYALYGEPDGPIGMDYFFWLLRNQDRTVLVDCGFDRERAARAGRSQDTEPLELLARMGVRAGDVDHIVISHMHYDHVGNLELFPNATVSMARKEFDFWTGPFGEKELMQVIVHPEDVQIVRKYLDEGRLQLIDDGAALYPGITATRLGGHTPGQLMVDVATTGGQLVLASDAIHYYEEMDRDRPFNLFDDIGEMYQAYGTLRDLAARADTTVVAGHDPRDVTAWTMVEKDCFDLTAPADAG